MYQNIDETIVRISDGACIPPDNNNKDYQDYLEWLALGNIPICVVIPKEERDYLTLRKEAYAEEADPLFFQEQRGEVPVGSWLAKIEEIKARYPKP